MPSAELSKCEQPDKFANVDALEYCQTGVHKMAQHKGPTMAAPGFSGAAGPLLTVGDLARLGLKLFR